MFKQLIVFGKQTAVVSSHTKWASSRVLQSLYKIEVGWFIRRRINFE